MGIGMKEKIDKYWGLWHTSNDHEMEEKGRAKGKGKEKEKENINCSLQWPWDWLRWSIPIDIEENLEELIMLEKGAIQHASICLFQYF
jgi:hypothetical protein